MVRLYPDSGLFQQLLALDRQKGHRKTVVAGRGEGEQIRASQPGTKLP